MFVSFSFLLHDHVAALLFACNFVPLSVMPCSYVNFDMRRFGAVCCRWHVAVLAMLFACSLMSLFCLDLKLISTCVVLAPSTVDSFMWAGRFSAAMLLIRHVTSVSLSPVPAVSNEKSIAVRPCST